ncbi:MAG: hypothetical protein V4549_18100 [Bacteroidota bacterium]
MICSDELETKYGTVISLDGSNAKVMVGKEPVSVSINDLKLIRKNEG